MFWRNQGFNNPFQRVNNINGSAYGQHGHIPLLNHGNPLLQRGNSFPGRTAPQQGRHGLFTGQPPQGQFAGQPPQSHFAGQSQGQFIGQPPQGQFAGQPPQSHFAGQSQGQFIGQPQQGQFMGPPLQAYGQTQNQFQNDGNTQLPQIPPSSNLPANAFRNAGQSGSSLSPPSIQNNPQLPPSLQIPSNSEPSGAPSLPIDKLQNVGTFMGYPEYTLPGSDLSKAASSANEGLAEKGPNPVFEGLKELIQNERNSRVFYGNLADMPSNESARESIRLLAERADTRSKRLMDIYKSTSGERFSPEDRQIRNDTNLFDGLRLAVREESRALRNCTQIADSTPDLALRERLMEIMVEKLCQINELNLLITD